MKNTILTFLIFLLPIVVLAQNDSLLKVLPLKDGKVYYSEVIVVDSSFKNELYSKAKKWFANTFKSANDVIQLDDKENGEILGKGYFEEYWSFGFAGSGAVGVFSTYKIALKDGKYKYEICDFRIKYKMPGNQYAAAQTFEMPIEEMQYKMKLKGQKELYIKIDNHINSIIEGLKKAMIEKPESW